MLDHARAGRHGALWLIAGAILAGLFLYILSVIWRTAATFLLADGQSLEFTIALRTGSTPEAMLVILGSFALWFPALALALRLIHGLTLRPVLGTPLVRQFFRVLNVLIAIHLVLWLMPPWDVLSGTGRNLNFSTWLTLLPLSLLGILVQSSAEEVFFRGYLQQQLAARFSTPVIWMGVPAILFGLGHYDSAGGSNAWLIVVWAGLFSLLMSDLTARAGSLGPAIAVHFASNSVSILIVAVPGALDGLALYTLPIGYQDEEAIRALMPYEFVLLIVGWLAARVAIRR